MTLEHNEYEEVSDSVNARISAKNRLFVFSLVYLSPPGRHHGAPGETVGAWTYDLSPRFNPHSFT